MGSLCIMPLLLRHRIMRRDFSVRIFSALAKSFLIQFSSALNNVRLCNFSSNDKSDMLLARHLHGSSPNFSFSRRHTDFRHLKVKTLNPAYRNQYFLKQTISCKVAVSLFSLGYCQKQIQCYSLEIRTYIFS